MEEAIWLKTCAESSSSFRDEFDNDPEQLTAYFIELQKQQSEESILAPQPSKKGKSAA